jgi:hypothetical protein
MVSQAYKEVSDPTCPLASVFTSSSLRSQIPKTVRTNFTGLMLFEVPSEGEIKAIYEENPVGMKREQWDEAYRYCTHDEYSFCYINYKRPKRLRMMKNFDQFVFIGKDQDDDAVNPGGGQSRGAPPA